MTSTPAWWKSAIVCRSPDMTLDDIKHHLDDMRELLRAEMKLIEARLDVRLERLERLRREDLAKRMEELTERMTDEEPSLNERLKECVRQLETIKAEIIRTLGKS